MARAAVLLAWLFLLVLLLCGDSLVAAKGASRKDRFRERELCAQRERVESPLIGDHDRDIHANLAR